jgi:hypothetical protein
MVGIELSAGELCRISQALMLMRTFSGDDMPQVVRTEITELSNKINSLYTEEVKKQ